MSSRKRPLEVDGSDFGPISKKLHKLQIDPLLPIPVIPIPSNDANSTTYFENPSNGRNGSHLNGCDASHLLSQTSLREIPKNEIGYNPVLCCKQNPIYYEVNRLLFEAHQMRITRSSTQCNQLNGRRRSMV